MTSSVEDITLNDEEGTISFKFVANYSSSGTGGGGGEEGDDPVVTPTGDYLFYESFNECSGKGGNDGEWSGSIANASFKPDNEGWEGNGSGAKQCAKFGTGKKKGTATTPGIKFSVNETTLTFKAAAWSEETTTLTLSAEGSTLTINPKSVTLSNNEWTTHTIKITGTGTAKIVFTPSNNRFFLDEVLIVDPNATTGISNVKREATANDRYYTLDGRVLNGVPTQKGIYIVNGRKVVIK